VQQALCDESPAVRAAAGAAFNQLFKGGGGSDALSEIVPALIDSLEGDDANALEGLKQVLKAQPRLLSSVLPRLASGALTVTSARVLGACAEVAGAALPAHLPIIFPPLLDACCSEDTEVAGAAGAAVNSVLLAVDSENTYQVISELLAGIDSGSVSRRVAACRLTGQFVQSSPHELDLPTVVGSLVVLLADASPEVVLAAWTALCEVTSKIPKEEQHTFVRCLRDAVSSAREKERRRARDKSSLILVSGFCLPKGLSPVIGIYLQGVLTGGADSRAAAAEGLGELVAVTSDESVRPHVVAVTGTLIRVVSDKFQSQVKAAILQTACILIRKGGAALKPFVPQLQTTCVKCLQDQSRAVRSRAVEALGLLMKLQTRIDPLLTELLNSLPLASDGGFTETTVLALHAVLSTAGSLVSAPVLARTVEELLRIVDGPPTEDISAACAIAVGAAAVVLDSGDLARLWTDLTQPATFEARPGRAALLAAALATSAQRLTSPAALLTYLTSLASDERAAARTHAANSSGEWLLRNPASAECRAVLAGAMRDESTDVRRSALLVLSRLARALPTDEALASLLPALLPGAVASLADVAIVKQAGEAALARCCRRGIDIVGLSPPAQKLRLTEAVMRRLTRHSGESDEE